MEINALPKYDMSDNPTNCCPRFNPEGWDEQELHFQDKLFVKARTRSIFHIPINMASVFPNTLSAIENADAMSEDNFLVLSYDPSPWTGEHYFAVAHDVAGQEMVHLTGEFLTKVFEGPYKEAPKMEKAMEDFVHSQGKKTKKTYFFYTTCPKCAKYYGKNYMIAVAEIESSN